MEDQEVLRTPEPKMTQEEYLRADKKSKSNLRRLKAVFNGNWKRGQKLPDGWKGDGFLIGKTNTKEREKAKTKTESQVERVMRKMKLRG